MNPAVEEVHALLEAEKPFQPRVALVHGDYRIDNVVLRRDGSVAAVLDWELCTLGDPLADLGWLLAYWAQPGESAAHLGGRAPTTAPGFPDRAAVAARYAEATGADLTALAFHVALATWKLACIAEGVFARYRAGVMGDHAAPEEVAAIGDQVVRLGDEALALTERLAPAGS